MKSCNNNCWIKDNNIKVSFLVSMIWGLIKKLFGDTLISQEDVHLVLYSHVYDVDTFYEVFLSNQVFNLAPWW